MNKTKLTLAVIGGVVGFATLVMAYFIWNAYSANTAAMEGDDEEGTEGLETVVEKAKTLSRKAIYPCQESLTALEANRERIADWQLEAEKLASRGDRDFQATTAPAFKTDIMREAKRLAALPGAVGGVIVRGDFAFGPFKDYIVGGSIPTEAQLPELQRRWDDVVTLFETFAQCGVASIDDIKFVTVEPEKKPEEKRGNNRRNARKQEAVEPKLAPVAYTYIFNVSAKPAAFVKAMNALATCERFVTVDSFTFGRPVDALSAALGGSDKNAESSGGGGGRRRGRGRQDATMVNPFGGAAGADGEKKPSFVTDPILDAPLAVVMKITVRDFRSMEEGKSGAENGEEVKK